VVTSFIEEAEQRAHAVLMEVEAATQAFATKSGIKCREGCGECCLKPGIEAQVVELLPLARDLTNKGEAELWYERAVKDPDGRCVFYKPSVPDQTLGRCGQYELRPSLCRLFGFAAVSGKNGKPQLASCKWHKSLAPDVVARAQAEIDGGGEVPLYSDASMQMRLISPDSGLSERLPINRALARALEKINLTHPVG
jgi:Fe-S-cluster containining protein